MALALLWTASVFEEQQRPSAMASPAGEGGGTGPKYEDGDEDDASEGPSSPKSPPTSSSYFKHDSAARTSKTEGRKDDAAAEDVEKKMVHGESVGKKSSTRKRQRLSEASTAVDRSSPAAAEAGDGNDGDNDHAARTAAWLDRARTILSNNSSDPSDVEGQLRELEQLIREGASAVGRGRRAGEEEQDGTAENSTAVCPSSLAPEMVTATSAVNDKEVPPQQNKFPPQERGDDGDASPVGPVGPSPAGSKRAPQSSRDGASASSPTFPRKLDAQTTPPRNDVATSIPTPPKGGPAAALATATAPPPPRQGPGGLTDGADRNDRRLPPLRRGKWTAEEEEYVARVIHDFNRGYLDAPPGTTLRTYLSEKLHCDPMRITKKFTGESCIGKRVFHPAGSAARAGTVVGPGSGGGGAAATAIAGAATDVPGAPAPGAAADADGEGEGGAAADEKQRPPAQSAADAAETAGKIETAQAELRVLERRWRRRMEMQEREACGKRAAAVAAAASSSSMMGGTGNPVSFPLLDAAVIAGSIPAHVSQENRHALARTAAWLHRAGAVLRNSTNVPPHPGGDGDDDDGATAAKRNLEHEMREVKELIHEGDAIRRVASSVIPRIFDVGLGVASQSPVTKMASPSSPSLLESSPVAKTAAAVVSTSAAAPGAVAAACSEDRGT